VAGPVLLLDSYSLLFRAHFALPVMNTEAGEPTAALYGFFALLVKLLREQRPSAVCFAVDTPKKSFRRERYAEYKANRVRAPSVLLHQLHRVATLLESLELPVLGLAGYEADDVLATLARRLEQERRAVLIVTGDRDLLQLVTDEVRVLFVGGRGQGHVLFDVAGVERRYGVVPARLPAFAALVGDASDNLPGVPGVGDRTASKLIQRYATIDEIFAHLDEITPARLRESLARCREQILLNEELTRLDPNVPLSDVRLAGEVGLALFAGLRQIFETLEFKSLLPRLEKVDASFRDGSRAVDTGGAGVDAVVRPR
jgi:DNA polymerase-1